MKDKQVEIPRWCAALWLFGPYAFACSIIALFSEHVLPDLLIILFLICGQIGQILYAPCIHSFAGGLMCSFAMFSLCLLGKGMTCGPIRSMITMELVMNGGFRYVHLLSDDALRSRSFTHRLAFVTIFSDVQSAKYVDTTTAWVHLRKILRHTIVAVLIATSTWLALAYVDFAALNVASVFGITPEIFPRVFLGALLIYSSLTIIDGVYRGSLLLVRPFGILCESAMDEPYFATSFANFWGKRWDKPMQTILYYGTYQPVRKFCGSTAVAVLATFVVSGVVHTLGVAACGWVSLETCAMMMSFFAVHAVFVLLEGIWKQQGIIVTQTLCWLSAPLFVLPFLKLLKL